MSIIVLKELSNDSGANSSKVYVESFGDSLGEEDGKGRLAVGACGAELGRGMLVEPDYVLIYPLPVKGRRRAKDHLLLVLVELTWVR